MPVDKRRSRYIRPQRDNAGIILPEYVLFGVLRDMQDKLAKGRYLYDSGEEPFLLNFVGLSRDTLEQVYKYLKNNVPKVSLSFPKDRIQLPQITIMPEEQSPEGTVMGHAGGHVDEDRDTESSHTLTPVGGAVGGETTFRFPHSDIIVGSETIVINRGSVTIPMYRVGGDYTLDREGNLELTGDYVAGLVAGDVLTVTSYSRYGLPGGIRYTSIEAFTHVLLIDTLNPVVTSALYGIVWRELMVKKNVIQDVGLTDLLMTRRSQSLWDQINPPYGHRTEMVVQGLTEWTVYQRVESPKTINVDIDSTSGDNDSVVLLQMDINEVGINPFDE